MTSRSPHNSSSTSNEVPVPSIYSTHSLGSPRSPNKNSKNNSDNIHQDRTRSPNPNIIIKTNNDVEDTATRTGNHHGIIVSTPSENDNSGGANGVGRNTAYVAQQQQQSNLNTLPNNSNNSNNSRNHSRNHSRKTSSNNPETSQQQQHRNLGDHSLITGGGADAISFDRDDDSLTREEDDGFDDDDITVTATNLSTAPPIVRPGVNQCPHGTLQASESNHGGGRRISASGGGGVRSSATQQIMFGPNRSAMSMLKALRFSPFVAVNTRRNNHNNHNNNNNNNNNDNDDDDSARSDDFYRAGDPGRVPTTPWEFFTPSMTQYYSVIGYLFAIVMFSCSIASIVARHKTKPNTPIECDYRLDQSLAWLAGLMMPEAIFVPVWSAIFLQHVYPPLYQASRVPLERTFRHYGHFIGFSSFLAVLTVAIFGSSLYALSVAKSWDFVEHEACGYSFSALRTIAIFGISSIGFIAVAHFIHWAYLNKKLDEIRGVVRPIPAEN